MPESELQNPENERPVQEDTRGGRRQIATIVLCLVPFFGSVLFAMRETSGESLKVTKIRPSLVFNSYLIYATERETSGRSLPEFEYVFHNRGQEPVRLKELSPSCGCLTPTASPTEVLPGMSGRVKVPVRTAGEQPGFHEYMVTVKYSDPVEREVQLYLKVELPDEKVLIEPRALYLMGESAAGHRQSVTISDYRPEPMKIVRVTSMSPLFSAVIASQTRETHGVRTVIEVAMAQRLPAGRQSGIVQVETDDAEFRLLQIPVAVSARERSAEDSEKIRIEPEEISLRAETDAAAVLRLTIPASWNVSHIVSYPDELTVQQQDLPGQSEGVRRVELQLRLSGTPTIPVSRGVITLVANDGSEMLSVPVRMVWPSGAKSQ